MQPRHCVAQLRHDAFAGPRPAAVNEAEHATGHRLAVDGRADEERAAQHRRVGADVMDVGDRDTGLLGEGADGRLAGDVEQLDRRGGDHRQGEAPRLRAGDGVEERVDASSAGRRQREALDDDGSVLLPGQPRRQRTGERTGRRTGRGPAGEPGAGLAPSVAAPVVVAGFRDGEIVVRHPHQRRPHRR